MLYRPDSPPMGWNSFDCFGWSVDEREFKENADYVAEKLKPYGYEYCVVDFCWAYPGKGRIAPPDQTRTNGVADVPLRLDAFGRPMPATEKFPSCTDGFKPLADYVHAKGLKFGVHLMRGIPWDAVAKKLPILGSEVTADKIISGENCDWLNHNAGIDMTARGAQEYVDSMAALMEEWEVDFVKLDDALRPYRKAEIEAFSLALDRLGRKIVLSLSPGETPLEEAGHLERYATMWRIMDDLWDRKSDLKKIVPLALKWASRHVDRGYPDLDMLPIGRLLKCDDGVGRDSRFNTNNKRYLMALWAIAKSPLIIGGHLPETSVKDIGLLTHPDIITLTRKSVNNRILSDDPRYPVWAAEAENTEYIAFFNATNAIKPFRFPLRREYASVTEAFTGKTKPLPESLYGVIPPLGVRLFRLKRV